MNTNCTVCVVGVGGCGANVVNRMLEDRRLGVRYVVIDTEGAQSAADRRVLLGNGNLPRGDVGAAEQAAQGSRREIASALEGAAFVAVVCGLGGGAGSGVAPVVAEIAREKAIPVVGLAYRPFAFEGMARRQRAAEGLRRLEGAADAVMIADNDAGMGFAIPGMQSSEAFGKLDASFAEFIRVMAELLAGGRGRGMDARELGRFLRSGGRLFLGSATGDTPEAADAALKNKLLNVDVSKAKSALIRISTGPNAPGALAGGMEKQLRSKLPARAEAKVYAIPDEALGQSAGATLIASCEAEQSAEGNRSVPRPRRPAARDTSL